MLMYSKEHLGMTAEQNCDQTQHTMFSLGRQMRLISLCLATGNKPSRFVPPSPSWALVPPNFSLHRSTFILPAGIH